jgi:hypothetical protein
LPYPYFAKIRTYEKNYSDQPAADPGVLFDPAIIDLDLHGDEMRGVTLGR